MTSRSEILYHLFELLHSPIKFDESKVSGEHVELYNKIKEKHAELYNRKACHVYARQCAIIGILAEYLCEKVEKVTNPTCVKCGGCRRFTGR